MSLPRRLMPLIFASCGPLVAQVPDDGSDADGASTLAAATTATDASATAQPTSSGDTSAAPQSTSSGDTSAAPQPTSSGDTSVTAGASDATGVSTAAAAATDTTASETGTTANGTTLDGTTSDGPLCGPPCGPGWEHPDDLYLGPGDDLAQYACVTRVGGLELHGAIDAAALSVFANLRTIDGSLVVADNDLIDRLDAFACLQSVAQGVYFDDLPALVDLSGLASLSHAQSFALEQTGALALPAFAADFDGILGLRVIANPALADIGAVASWSAVGAYLDLEIRDAPALTSVAPLANLLTTGPEEITLVLDDLPALTSLQGLEGATHGYVALVRLPLIKDLKPVGNLGSVDPWGSALWISGMPLVKSLSGLSGIETLDGLNIGGCPEGPNGLGMDGLTSLAGLDSLGELQTLRLGNNANLDSLTGAGALHTVYELQVVGNPKVNQQEFDALLAQLGPGEFDCFGEWGVCWCQDLMP